MLCYSSSKLNPCYRNGIIASNIPLTLLQAITETITELLSCKLNYRFLYKSSTIL